MRKLLTGLFQQLSPPIKLIAGIVVFITGLMAFYFTVYLPFLRPLTIEVIPKSVLAGETYVIKGTDIAECDLTFSNGSKVSILIFDGKYQAAAPAIAGRVEISCRRNPNERAAFASFSIEFGVLVVPDSGPPKTKFTVTSNIPAKCTLFPTDNSTPYLFDLALNKLLSTSFIATAPVGIITIECKRESGETTYGYFTVR